MRAGFCSPVPAGLCFFFFYLLQGSAPGSTPMFTLVCQLAHLSYEFIFNGDGIS